jgi:hypothetical protein
MKRTAREVRVANKSSKEGKSHKYSRRRFLGQVGACGAALAGAPLVFTATESVRQNSGEPVASASHSADEPASIPDLQPAATIEFINPNPPAFKDLEYAGEYYDAVVPATLDLAERARLRWCRLIRREDIALFTSTDTIGSGNRSIRKSSVSSHERRLPGGKTAFSSSERIATSLTRI